MLRPSSCAQATRSFVSPSLPQYQTLVWIPRHNRVCVIESYLRRATTESQDQVKGIAALETVLFGRLVVVPTRRSFMSVYEDIESSSKWV